ncbi:hypothetical protein [Streptomyces sp. NPDC003832]
MWNATTPLGSLAWAFGPPPGAPAVCGVDVITVRDGRIADILTRFMPDGHGRGRDVGGGCLDTGKAVAEREGGGACLPRLHTFATGLEKDWEAVLQGLSTRWNSGPVEGRVNHIKMIKRQMFGRAKLPLLRKRVLLTAAANR